MDLLAQITMSPGGWISWIVVGLISGWLAGVVMSGGGYGVIGDIVLGLIGAVIGGVVSSFVIQGDAGFWGSIVVAFIGACIVIAIARAFAPHRSPRM